MDWAHTLLFTFPFSSDLQVNLNLIHVVNCVNALCSLFSPSICTQNPLNCVSAFCKNYCWCFVSLIIEMLSMFTGWVKKVNVMVDKSIFSQWFKSRMGNSWKRRVKSKLPSPLENNITHAESGLDFAKAAEETWGFTSAGTNFGKVMFLLCTWACFSPDQGIIFLKYLLEFNSFLQNLWRSSTKGGLNTSKFSVTFSCCEVRFYCSKFRAWEERLLVQVRKNKAFLDTKGFMDTSH